MLLLTFTLVLAIKDCHFHTYFHSETGLTTTGHHASVGGDCYICDFVMHESTVQKAIAFIPVISITLIHFVSFSPQIVYRQTGSINAHAPPAVA